MFFFIYLADSFWTNPQYRVRVVDNNSEKTGEKNMLLSLMQKPDKRNRRLVQNLHIGFTVFEVSVTSSLQPQPRHSWRGTDTQNSISEIELQTVTFLFVDLFAC